MKCITIVVVLVAASANASLVSHVGLVATPYSQISYSTFHQAPYYRHVIPAVSHHQPRYTSPVPVSHIHRLAAPYPAYTTARLRVQPVKQKTSTYYTAPVAVWAKAPAVYTALTRGSFHQARLEGHEVSQTSINVAPASGTW